MARRSAHEPPSSRSTRPGPRDKSRPGPREADPRWRNADTKTDGEPGDSWSSARPRKSGGFSGQRTDATSRRRNESNPSSREPRFRKEDSERRRARPSDDTRLGDPWAGSRERRPRPGGRREEPSARQRGPSESHVGRGERRPSRDAFRADSRADRGERRGGRNASQGARRAPRGDAATSRRGRDTTRGSQSEQTRPQRAASTPRGTHSTAQTSEGEGERLQKVLSRAGLASRREVEDWIRAGRITINGQPAVLGVRVSPSDQLRLDGRLIRQRETTSGPSVFVVHRSPGESLTQPHSETPTEEGGEAPPATTAMIERLPSRAGKRFITISPMPRVDGGLELVTSDGELGVRLQRTVHNLVSQFSVRVLGELSPEQLEGILAGALDSGEQIEVQSCEPAGGEGANRWYTFIARGASGKEVRQLFERQGALVSRVQRTHLGPITMERTLGRGQFRELTSEELAALTAE